MKVAVLSTVAWRTPPRHYGPWEQIASNVCEGMHALGHEVTLFATGDSVTAGPLNAVIPLGYEEDRSQDVKVVECLHISNLMEQAADFDIIHNHFDFLPLTYSRLVKTPMVTTIHGFSSIKIVPVYKKYNSSSWYVSISDSDRRGELNYAATVYNGVDTSAFTLQENKEDYLLFFGRIHPDKGTAEAIEIAKASERGLIIAGIKQDERYFREEIEPRLNEDIVYIGEAGPSQRDILLGNAAALLHPINFDEPFGLSVVESMLCGTPVIAFNRGSMPELIVHEETGFLVRNIAEAVSAVSRLASLKPTLVRQYAASRFSSERMCMDYEKVYQGIITGKLIS